jgi:hypothetical protein
MKARTITLIGALAASTLPLLVQAANGDRAAKRQAREAVRPNAAAAQPDLATAAGALATAVVGAAQGAAEDAPEASGDAGKKGRRQRACFDFSKQTTGTTWTVNQEIRTGFGKVVVREFVIDGKKYTPQTDVQTQYLKVNSSQIAQGSPPELHGSLINVQIVPDKPVRGISMKFAQQLGVTGQLPANLEVNGDRHDFRGALTEANGKEIGDAAKGVAKLRVNLVADASTPEHPNSYWHRGTVEARATSGAIETLSFGAQAFNFDDVCIYR